MSSGRVKCSLIFRYFFVFNNYSGIPELRDLFLTFFSSIIQNFRFEFVICQIASQFVFEP